jgi:hypothetical protein
VDVVAVVVVVAFWAFDDRRNGPMTAIELTAEMIRQNRPGPDRRILQKRGHCHLQEAGQRL